MGSHKKKTLCVGKCTSEGLDYFILFFKGVGGRGRGRVGVVEGRQACPSLLDSKRVLVTFYPYSL